jgi:hypothetical protein
MSNFPDMYKEYLTINGNLKTEFQNQRLSAVQGNPDGASTRIRKLVVRCLMGHQLLLCHCLDVPVGKKKSLDACPIKHLASL